MHMGIVRLCELTMTLFKEQDSWRVLEGSYQDEDISLSPAYKNKSGLILKSNGEVWCLSKAKFSDGTECLASSLCRGDSDYGPLLWSVWNGIKLVPLFVPPAPDFVLEIEGPAIFCNEFNKKLNEVFPIRLEVIPMFEIDPSNRFVLIGIEGIIL